MFPKTIAIGLSPNTESDDFFCAIKILFQPWKWKKGSALNGVEDWFKKYLNTRKVYTFDSGRSALFFILKSFGINTGAEILTQAFTCVAIPNAIIKSGAVPIYVDIDETGNIDPKLISQKINSKTKAIIIQHTFGIPADIEEIKKIAKDNKLILIEDCAHALGVGIGKGNLGQFGDASFFSFGRDKVLSSVFGGLAVINNVNLIKNNTADSIYSKLKYPNSGWILSQLLHPILITLIKPIYSLKVGKFILLILQKIRVLSKPVTDNELKADIDSQDPKKYPNGLAFLLLNQLSKLDQYSLHRAKIVKYYLGALKELRSIKLPIIKSNFNLLRFNILSEHGEELIKSARKRGIILGNWYRNVIDPAGADLNNINYYQGMCKRAEKFARRSVNLPTYPTLSSREMHQVGALLIELCK